VCVKQFLLSLHQTIVDKSQIFPVKLDAGLFTTHDSQHYAAHVHILANSIVSTVALHATITPPSCTLWTNVSDKLHFGDKQNSQTVKPQIQKISINLTHWTMKTPHNGLKMSIVSRDISRDATDWWLQQQSNGPAFSIWLTVWLSFARCIHRLRWKCHASCVLSRLGRLRNKSSKFYKLSSVLNKIMLKIFCFFCGHCSLYKCSHFLEFGVIKPPHICLRHRPPLISEYADENRTEQN